MRNNTTQCPTFINVHKIWLQQGSASHCQHRFYKITTKDKVHSCYPQHFFTWPKYRSKLVATIGRSPANPVTGVHRLFPKRLGHLWPLPATQLRRFIDLVIHNSSAQCLIWCLTWSDLMIRWCLFALTTFALYMNWRWAQLSRPFTKWTWARIVSTQHPHD